MEGTLAGLNGQNVAGPVDQESSPVIVHATSPCHPLVVRTVPTTDHHLNRNHVKSYSALPLVTGLTGLSGLPVPGRVAVEFSLEAVNVMRLVEFSTAWGRELSQAYVKVNTAQVRKVMGRNVT